MNTLALTAGKLGIADSGIAAVLGYLVVFFGLVLLMAVVILMGKAMAGTNKKAEAKAPAAAPAPAAPAASAAPPAPGSAGEVKLFDVPDKEAAMIMAIVADKMGKIGRASCRERVYREV